MGAVLAPKIDLKAIKNRDRKLLKKQDASVQKCTASPARDVLVFDGDGVGPEIITAARRVADASLSRVTRETAASSLPPALQAYANARHGGGTLATDGDRWQALNSDALFQVTWQQEGC